MNSWYGLLSRSIVISWAVLQSQNVDAQKWPKDQCMGLYDCPSKKKSSDRDKSSAKSSSKSKNVGPVNEGSMREKAEKEPEPVYFNLKLAMDALGPFTYETFDYSSIRGEQKYAPLLRTLSFTMGALFSSTFMSHGPDLLFRFAETYKNDILRFRSDNSLDYKESISVSSYGLGLAYNLALSNSKQRFWDPQISFALERPIVHVRAERSSEQTGDSSQSSAANVRVAGTLGYVRLSSGWWFEWKALDTGIGFHAYFPFAMNLTHDSESISEEELKDRLNVRQSHGFGIWIGAGW
jgi:hypothetical protein